MIPPRRWPRGVSPMKPGSRRALAGGGVSLDWKQTWLPQSLWKTSQVMSAFLVNFRPSLLLEEAAKNSPLAAQTMLTTVSLDNRKGRRKAIAWSTLGKWTVSSPDSLGPVTRFRAWSHCCNHDQQSTLSLPSTFFHGFLVDSKMKKHQQIMKSFTVYISNGRREDVHWAIVNTFIHCLKKQGQSAHRLNDNLHHTWAGRINPTSFQSNPAETPLSRKLSLSSERLGLSSPLRSFPEANPLRPGILCVGKRTKNARAFSQLQKSPTLEMITN